MSKNIPKIGDTINSPLNFKLTKKSYRTEEFEAPIQLWNGIKVRPAIYMRFHTFLQYWDVFYSYYYGHDERYVVDIKSKGHLTRKEARQQAFKWIKHAHISDINDLSEFYQNSIIEHQ